MRVRPKYFDYDTLPCVGCKDHLMADYGTYMSPGPKIPGLGQSIQDYYGGFPETDLPYSRVQGPVPIGTPPDTSKVKPGPIPTSPPGLNDKKKQQPGFNSGQALLGAMSAFDALLPNPYKKHYVVQPQMQYNPHPYGTGSQALKKGGTIPMADYGYYVGEDENNSPSAKSGIHIKPSKRGTLHDALGISRDKKIPTSRLADKPGDSPALKKKKNFARNARKWKHDDGGMIPFMPDDAEEGTAVPMLFGAMEKAAGLPGQVGGQLLPMLLKDGGFLDDYTAKDGKWIQKAVNPAHKGYCTPMTKSTCTPKRKALARTFKKMAKNRKGEEGDHINDYMDMITRENYMDVGGFVPMEAFDQSKTTKTRRIIPDNMSAFNPHRYENGGNVNGSAKLNMVDAKYPNSDLLEQWLLYKDGGDVNGGADIREVGATYPNTDLMEQWLLYANGGDLRPTQVRDSRGYASGPSGRYRYENQDPRNPNYMATRDYTPEGQYNAQVPQPEYRPLNLQQSTNYSATFPEGSEQKTAYFPDFGSWESFRNQQSGTLLSSQETANKTRASLAMKGRPMKEGGNVNGGAKVKDVNNIFPNTDLMEQWLLYNHGGPILPGMRTKKDGSWKMNKMFDDGGSLSSSKAKEMLKDGTAHGKALTKKQKQYFGMVAAGKAAYGTEIDPDPKPKAVVMPSAPGTLPKDSSINWDARKYQGSPIDRDALIADRVGEMVARGYDPYSGTGRALLNEISRGQAGTQFAQDFGTRLKILQQDPNFVRLSPEERMSKLYGTARGTSEFDQFLGRTKTLGGSPSAYLQGNPAVKTFASGGVMYDDGGEVDTMWGGNANRESYNPYDGGTIEFNGASHDNGGIGMHYNGKPVEVEGGEYASRGSDGALNVFGNMYVPGTKTKFKAAAKAISNKEKRYDFLKTRGSDLVNEYNPARKYDQLAFNAGRAMMDGGEMGQKDLASKKENLSGLQRAMLDTANEFGLDPHEMSKGKMKKAKGGASIPFYQDGGTDPGNDPTRADRNNNPGNMKYGKTAKKYGAKQDKDGFAIFPDKETGLKAMKELLKTDYKNMDIPTAIDTWTGHKPYNYNLDDISHKKVGDLSSDEFERLVSTMRKGEGTKYGTSPRKPVPTPTSPAPQVPIPQTFTPYDLPKVPGFTPDQPHIPGTATPPYDQLQIPQDKNLPSNVEPLQMNQLLGEIYAAATNKVEPVPAQRYEPQLYTPYQVSFQDRLNQNQRAYNAQARAVGAGNPAALGEVAAQKYAADSSALGDEFRTNQSISNDITNKNIGLVNDAQVKNLGIADTQMTRQSEARSKTRQLNQMILNSISDKYAKNAFENKRLAAYENLYDYRFVPTEDGGQRATYFGPNAMFNYNGVGVNPQHSGDKTITRYDPYGNVKGVAQYSDSDLREQQETLDILTKMRKLPLMQTPPLSPTGR